LGTLSARLQQRSIADHVPAHVGIARRCLPRQMQQGRDGDVRADAGGLAGGDGNVQHAALFCSGNKVNLETPRPPAGGRVRCGYPQA
jgi:hypothetical protein